MSRGTTPLSVPYANCALCANNTYLIWTNQLTGSHICIGDAFHECVSEDALVHLKTYKYSSVDKSLISRHILRHYVCKDSLLLLNLAD